ncbi:MAG: ribonuclease H-like domain-containing protein [Deltaproteobacteria bacterium]|nr:ribonuclease H-like domain-containing protein [Deltaproteobacteria bacterium]
MIKEKALWAKGILTWEDLVTYQLKAAKTLPKGGTKGPISFLTDWYAQSLKALQEGEVDFFLDSWPLSEHFRLALAYPEQVIFVDIETTGLTLEQHWITLIGWSVGQGYQVYVAGRDSPEQFLKDLASAKALVTFNGKIFDLKFLEKHFGQLPLPKVHVDLRYFCGQTGFKGGQKVIEKELGLFRPEASGDGRAAVRKWGEYKSGDHQTLAKLIRYNQADVEGMKYIFDACVMMRIEKGLLPQVAGLNNIFGAMAEKSIIGPKPQPENISVLQRQKLDYGFLNRQICLRELVIVGLWPVGSSFKKSKLSGEESADSDRSSTPKGIFEAGPDDSLEKATRKEASTEKTTRKKEADIRRDASKGATFQVVNPRKFWPTDLLWPPSYGQP